MKAKTKKKPTNATKPKQTKNETKQERRKERKNQ